MSRTAPIGKEYLALIRRFPLKPIRNESESDAALEVMRYLASKHDRRTQDENDYLSVLTRLIGDFEKSTQMEPKALTPAEALSYLMEENGLAQTDIAKLLGAHQSNISAFLAGKRGLSKEQVAKLAERFKVSPALFLPRPA